MSCNDKKFAGYTADAAENIQLDSGALFKNFVVGTDTYTSAIAAGKLIGATQGGSTFSAVPTIRTIAADGAKGKVKGLQVIDFWEVSMTPQLLEINKDSLADALGASDETIETFYEKVQARNYICDADYITNITFIGKISGKNKPIIIQMFNVINQSGIVMESTDEAEGIIPLELTAHYDPSTLNTAPFTIYYPKAEGTVSGIVSDGSPVEGATITITISGEDFVATSASDGTFTIEAVPYGTGYTADAVKAAETGQETGITVVGGADTDVGTITIS